MSGPIRRLSDATLSLAPAQVRRPAYDRAAAQVGVVHFGPGAFHRAHQAWYFDQMLTRDPGFGICAVSLRSGALRAALAPQDGLYALVEREAEPTVRVIGALKEVLTGPESRAQVFARLSDPGVRFVTSTVTEKGYCLTPAGDLDLDHPEVRRDLAAPETPETFVGWLVEGLRRRRAAGVGGLAAISCDNLADNGARLRRAAVQFAQARGDAGLAHWIEDLVAFPSTMVDSITPATDDALRTQAALALGLEDAWPIQRERFVQWVVEDALGAAGEAFAAAGVVLARDVGAFERAKLRLLNGAHSTLAYVGLRLGHETVAQAMADPALAGFIEALMRRDVAPAVPASELDTPAYIGEILTRFRNPAIAHNLAQIAWDGSQKLPFRLLETIAEALDAGRPVDRLAVGVAAWMLFVRRQARAGAPITDPMAGTLSAIGRDCEGLAARDVARFLALGGVFAPALAADPRFVQALERAYERLDGPSPEAALSI